MSDDRVAASEPVGSVIEKRCIGCGECVSVCAYGAVAMFETERGSKAVVDASLCQGDGLCSSLCATGAIVVKSHTNEEVWRQIDAALGRGEKGASDDNPAC